MASLANDNLKDNFIQGFLPKSRNGISSQLALPRKAAQLIKDLEIPGKKWEEWRYTRLNSLVSQVYVPGQTFEVTDISPFLIPNLEADVIVFLNGIYAPELSKVRYNAESLEISPISRLEDELLRTFETHSGSIIDTETNIFTALNALYIHNGVYIRAPKNVKGKAPVHLMHLSSGSKEVDTSVQHRNLFIAEPGSEFQVLESFHSIGNETTARNSLTEVLVKDNAKISYSKIQSENSASSQVDHTSAVLNRDSSFSIHTLTFGGKLLRNNLKIILDGENGSAELIGLYLLDGTQHVDNHTQVDHAKAHCYSNELYKGIMKDQSTGVFNGKIHVFQDAQKTNAFQSNRNILLSDTANIFTKPQLEIYADDVKCSHGATTGKLDQDAMFYLRARGLDEEKAKKLLIQAFAREVTDSIEIEEVKESLAEIIENRF
ncbi:MAG: Fe-S cluster assembly protein SufD [Bacteroidota bacterium]